MRAFAAGNYRADWRTPRLQINAEGRGAAGGAGGAPKRKSARLESQLGVEVAEARGLFLAELGRGLAEVLL